MPRWKQAVYTEGDPTNVRYSHNSEKSTDLTYFFLFSFLVLRHPQYGSVDDIFKNPTDSKSSLQKVQKKASSHSNSSFTIENDVPPWHPLYFIHSEVKRLLGPLKAEPCLLEDNNLHNDQSPSEDLNENHYPLQGPPESNDSRPLTQGKSFDISVSPLSY